MEKEEYYLYVRKDRGAIFISDYQEEDRSPFFVTETVDGVFPALEQLARSFHFAPRPLYHDLSFSEIERIEAWRKHEVERVGEVYVPYGAQTGDVTLIAPSEPGERSIISIARDSECGRVLGKSLMILIEKRSGKMRKGALPESGRVHSRVSL